MDDSVTGTKCYV